MSTESTPSPSQGPVREIDESRLPQGQCRYILLVPEIKGHRCACVGFSLNRAMPSATCDCGHLACYHIKTVDPSPDNQEVERLKQRIQDLEEQLEGEKAGSLRSVVTRVSQLEELVEKSREEATQMIQASSRHVSIAMHDIEQLKTQIGSIQTQVSGIDGRVKDLQNGQMELQDADEVLGERLELLESVEDGAPSRGRRRRNSASDLGNQMPMTPLRRRSSASLPTREDAMPSTTSIQVFPAPSTYMAFRGPSMTPATSSSWTAHISLLPSAALPFPFEKDTNAYKRCLSRGLHQIVVVSGPSSRAFVASVEGAFGKLLRGRPWMPLQAKPCNAEPLQGLPMLRQLDSDLVEGEFDLEFLKQHCAVCDPAGKIESLYIAMRSETFSWHFLHNSSVYKEGLEECWQYDRLLDRNAALNDTMDDDERPYAGEVVPNLNTLKRPAAEISRSSSFGSSSMSAESEASRAKLQRIHAGGGLEETPRRAAQRV